MSHSHSHEHHDHSQCGGHHDQAHAHTHEHGGQAHHHHHHHGEEAAFAEANANHYDADRAKNYDSNPWFAKYAKKLGEGLRNAYLFDKESTKMLDFACGTGGVSRELAPHVKSILGVDISPSAVDIFNARAVETGYKPETVRAISKMLKGEENELDGEKFDVVLCTMAYHHFPDILAITKTLASHLKPNGTLIIVDNLPDESQVEILPDEFTKSLEIDKVITERAKFGFTKELVEETFKEAGLDEGFRYIGPAIEPLMWPREGEEGYEEVFKTLAGKYLKIFVALGSKGGEKAMGRPRGEL